jgi:hypothetical protein
MHKNRKKGNTLKFMYIARVTLKTKPGGKNYRSILFMDILTKENQ